MTENKLRIYMDPLNRLEMPVRTASVLRANGIQSITQLMDLSQGELRRLHGLGLKGQSDVYFGLYFYIKETMELCHQEMIDGEDLVSMKFKAKLYDEIIQVINDIAAKQGA